MTESDEQVIARVAELVTVWKDPLHWRSVGPEMADLVPDLTSRLSTALAANRAKDEEIARLREAIRDAPHHYYCGINQRHYKEVTETGENLKCGPCDCWKSALALAKSQPKQP